MGRAAWSVGVVFLSLYRFGVVFVPIFPFSLLIFLVHLPLLVI